MNCLPHIDWVASAVKCMYESLWSVPAVSRCKFRAQPKAVFTSVVFESFGMAVKSWNQNCHQIYDLWNNISTNLQLVITLTGISNEWLLSSEIPFPRLLACPWSWRTSWISARLGSSQLWGVHWLYLQLTQVYHSTFADNQITHPIRDFTKSFTTPTYVLVTFNWLEWDLDVSRIEWNRNDAR